MTTPYIYLLFLREKEWCTYRWREFERGVSKIELHFCILQHYPKHHWVSSEYNIYILPFEETAVYAKKLHGPNNNISTLNSNWSWPFHTQMLQITEWDSIISFLFCFVMPTFPAVIQTHQSPCLFTRPQKLSSEAKLYAPKIALDYLVKEVIQAHLTWHIRISLLQQWLTWPSHH